jgi:hypothetical protein
MTLVQKRVRVRWHVLLGIITLFAAACLDEGLTGSSTVTGAYALRTINGAPLPYTMSGSGANKTELVSDVITLFQGGTYSRQRDIRTTTNGQVTHESTTEGGAYTLLGNSISMRAAGTGPQILAIINGNTMTIVDAGVTSVFSK